ncbi:MAG: thiamine phosphate synthase [Verrucomicrobia bacterium CG_4_10_14_3_um_filter_43_23]|nr:MAG: thiamine phosphate synthase [Verrucomicrobia bacterium CG22_combo_CG10-13_8_21_14_all_43_17]PIX58476.1 MAG: thiamine phosphate synthase [Verrucomicrobia bacterium CG_4_10_14_3_um_filter_43_23]PIY62226.1 MAG: thiamine phosphate synthase [Verrucomicrobia bacterium CG_4_10_14_0_8_um_filter_43_34]PJA44310.1 MAG: thiamine phosphate synthase [Verrucomicrobia bacterium CG_4_9_14_3_um_filter_43_20]
MHKEELLNRARFYAILDTAYVEESVWVETCAKLISGGADLIQLRAKRETPEQRRELLEAILPLFKGNTIPLIINDDLELALSYPTLGLHIGQEDTPARIARIRLGPDRILGLSTHSLKQATEALALENYLDYFALGPIFATQTKPNYPPVGLELIKAVNALNPKIPFFCIGGITHKNISQVAQAGAKRVVAVSDVFQVENMEKRIHCYKEALNTFNLND